MYKITFLTLFPDSFSWLSQYSIIKKAINKKLVNLEIVDFRNWSNNKHKKVDDYQFGGGPGMVISLQAICDCLSDIKTNKSKVILLSPSGKKYNQQFAKNLVKFNHLILICGHYEGFDSRLINYVDEEISIGDFIVSGGEIPAMLLADSIIRLIDGTINNESLLSESFNDNLLDYPIYTKPYNYNGYKVPDVLLSGNHQLIEQYRYDQKIEQTKLKRPDLYKKYLDSKRGNKNECNKNK